MSADERRAIRQEKTKPRMEAFEQLLSYNRAQVSAKSPTGLALKYIAKYWIGLNLFLTDPLTELLRLESFTFSTEFDLSSELPRKRASSFRNIRSEFTGRTVKNGVYF